MTIDDIEPRLFSFNNPLGACPDCNGLGKKLSVSADLVIDSNANIEENIQMIISKLKEKK